MHLKYIPIAVLVGLTACGMDTHEEDPAEAACEEREEAGTSIAPTAIPGPDSPAVTIGAEPYSVALAGSTGYLRLVSDEADEAFIAFFESAGVLTNLYEETTTAPTSGTFFMYDQGGTTRYIVPTSITSAGTNEFCATEIGEHFDIELETAGTYYLELTATSAQWMYLSSAEGHEDGS